MAEFGLAPGVGGGDDAAPTQSPSSRLDKMKPYTEAITSAAHAIGIEPQSTPRIEKMKPYTQAITRAPGASAND